MAIEDHGKLPEQAGAIPWMHGNSGLKILLITSSSGDRWIVPKGWIAPWFSPAETARREAYEEAGVEGVLSPRSIGSLDFKRGSRILRVELYSLEVIDVHFTWPEAFRRRRVWLAPEEAAHVASERGLAPLILALGERLAVSRAPGGEMAPLSGR